MLVGVIAYLIQDWRNLQMTLSILVFCLAGLWLVIPESPRWLLSKGKIDKAKKILLKGAAFNKKQVPKAAWEAVLSQDYQEGVQQMGFLDLFKGTYSYVPGATTIPKTRFQRVTTTLFQAATFARTP